MGAAEERAATQGIGERVCLPLAPENRTESGGAVCVNNMCIVCAQGTRSEDNACVDVVVANSPSPSQSSIAPSPSVLGPSGSGSAIAAPTPSPESSKSVPSPARNPSAPSSGSAAPASAPSPVRIISTPSPSSMSPSPVHFPVAPSPEQVPSPSPSIFPDVSPSATPSSEYTPQSVPSPSSSPSRGGGTRTSPSPSGASPSLAPSQHTPSSTSPSSTPQVDISPSPDETIPSPSANADVEPSPSPIPSSGSGSDMDSPSPSSLDMPETPSSMLEPSSSGAASPGSGSDTGSGSASASGSGSGSGSASAPSSDSGSGSASAPSSDSGSGSASDSGSDNGSGSASDSGSGTGSSSASASGSASGSSPQTNVCDVLSCGQYGRCDSVKGCVCDDLFAGEKCDACAVPGHTFPKCDEPMPPAIIPTNKNYAIVNVVFGIKTIKHGTATAATEGGNSKSSIGRSGSTQAASSSSTSSLGSLDDTAQSRMGVVIYDEKFDISEESCQMHLQTTCETLNDRADIVQKNSGLCTLTAFKDWLAETKKLQIPVTMSNSGKSVHELLAEFVHTDVGKKYVSKVIFNRVPEEEEEEEGTTGGVENSAAPLETLHVKAMVFKFYSLERSFEGGFDAMEAFRLWDKALTFINDGAPSSAGIAFHTSKLWTRAITEVIAVTGTVTGVSLVLLSSFLVVWLFTSSARAAMICSVILIAVLTITSGLFWLFGWELGIVEAVGISILLGAAVDYPAHVVERFIEIGHVDSVHSRDSSFQAILPLNQISSDDDANPSRRQMVSSTQTTFGERRRRVIASLTSVGISVLNASATTVMSCFVLIFCTVQIFQKVGVIMLTASAVSITATIVPLPAVLTKYGPKPFIRTLRKRVVVAAFVLGASLGVFVVVAVINQTTGGALWTT